MSGKKYDVVIIGGGHNGLVAATYLARAGKSVRIVEANAEIGGATQSVRAFPEYDANLSRYSYLIALLPDKIVNDLGLSFECVSREVSSYTPYGENKGLYVSRLWDSKTESSFLELDPSGNEGQAWQDFYSEVGQFAERIAPTLLEPLKTRSELREQINLDQVWQYLVEEPIGKVITERFHNDIVRGVVLTDALIGTFASAFDIQANICFLYHLIGNGTGEWKVPKGGMGALTSELVQKALSLGVEIKVNAKVKSIDAQSTQVVAELENGEKFAASYLLSNAAPQVLAQLLGKEQPKSLEGSQVKINMLLKKMPKFKSGIDAKDAFVGTLHINESFAQLEKAYKQANSGIFPDELPLEMYCHSLSDNSILSDELNQKGFHTLTIFALHTPAKLFDKEPVKTKELAKQRALSALNQYLVEPIESCLANDANGDLCIEVKSPIDLENEIFLPRGNIFHKDLSLPFKEDGSEIKWGVETNHPRVFLCGAGAIRGGGVSGIAGHNAAMAVLELN